MEHTRLNLCRQMSRGAPGMLKGLHVRLQASINIAGVPCPKIDFNAPRGHELQGEDNSVFRLAGYLVLRSSPV